MSFLGFDLSTQGLKVIVTDKDLKAQGLYNVEFDAEYREKYHISHGVITNEEDGSVLSPVAMWLDAIDLVFGRMKEDNFDFSLVLGMSGSGQQHGLVYWSKAAESGLGDLNASELLAPQLKDCLAYEFSPNWQDHSTGKELEDFEKTKGVEELAADTGSRAHYRFTGLQIRKLATRGNPEAYAKTWRISLVSSFLASVLMGKVAPLEEADACGMNLYNIKEDRYDDQLLAIAAGVHQSLDGASDAEAKTGVDELKKKLGLVSPVGYDSIGKVSSYFVEKFNFNPDCRVYSFTGDNLATIISLPLAPRDCLVSLGTSTTVLIVTDTYHPLPQYHLFKHPTMPRHYMGMLCYCNGSLPRNEIRDEINKKQNGEDKLWEAFDDCLEKSGKFSGKLGIYFTKGEIIPNAAAQTKRAVLREGKIYYVDIGDEWQVEDDATAIVTSQTCSCRLRSGPMLSRTEDSTSKGNKEIHEAYENIVEQFGTLRTDGEDHSFESVTAKPSKCFYVGGASNNQSLIRKMGSIFSPTNGNFKVDIPNACALGGAYKASWSYTCEEKQELHPYEEYISRLTDEYHSFDVEDHWLDHFPALGMLSKMESELNQ